SSLSLAATTTSRCFKPRLSRIVFSARPASDHRGDRRAPAIFPDITASPQGNIGFHGEPFPTLSCRHTTSLRCVTENKPLFGPQQAPGARLVLFCPLLSVSCPCVQHPNNGTFPRVRMVLMPS